jgi:hypothetical protein
MVDDLQAQSVAVEHCSWCSAEIAPALATCPACGATLTGDSDASLPGVTALDPEAIARAKRPATPQRRNRLLSWISGDYDDGDDVAAPPGSLSPPPLEVRREMLRLELAAEVASLQAQNDALVAEAEIEGRGASPLPTAATVAPEPQPTPTAEAVEVAGDTADTGDTVDTGATADTADTADTDDTGDTGSDSSSDSD